AILDGDLGQSDIGPPCTLAYAVVSKPVTDLFNLTADDVFFVGVTSPSKAVEKVLQGMAFLRDAVFKRGSEFVIVNTDGWVEGEDAMRYKARLIEEIKPNVIFCIQRQNELAPLLNLVNNDAPVIRVESPPTIKQRSREKRKTLRELGYIKYLRNPKVQSIPINWLEIEDREIAHLFSGNFNNSKQLEKISRVLGVKPIHFAETAEEISIVIGKGKWVDAEKIKELEDILGKKIDVRVKGQEEGLIVALYNGADEFLGIGVISEIDYRKKIIKILTPVSEQFSKVIVGKVKLDKNFKEVPASMEKVCQVES
ncbi:hypothetical protein H5T51_00760, partial [Candidatus Bathyarchaeota archaeon]|nr:hypothetical protein [Candidatus Bathyarchaeota archaeon]